MKKRMLFTAMMSLMLAPCMALAEKISKHTVDGWDEYYWTKNVSCKRGEAHTFWIKDLTENTAITGMEVYYIYKYKEDGETYEDWYYASESCENDDGTEKYVLLTVDDWEDVPGSGNVSFTVYVDGWEPETTADATFTFGHSEGDGDYPGEDPEPEPGPTVGTRENPYRLALTEAPVSEAQTVECTFADYFEDDTYYIIASPVLVPGRTYYFGIGGGICSNLTLSIAGTEIDLKTAAKAYEGWPNATVAWEYVPTWGGKAMVTVQGCAGDSFVLYCAVAPCKLTFDPNNGTTSDKQIIEVQWGRPIGTLPVVYRDGFDFAGWYTEDGTRIVSSTIVRGDATYYAKWLNFQYYTTHTGPGGSAIKWSYIVTNGVAVCYGADSAEGVLTIPPKLGGYNVGEVGDGAFADRSALSEVRIPAGVTSVRSYAFSGCSGLKHVTIPSSVTQFGIGAFNACTNIADVTVPGWTCGIDFSTVTNLVISEGVTTVEDYAFSDCGALMHVTIPSSVTSIGVGAFSGRPVTVDSANLQYKSVDGLLLSKDGRTLFLGANENEVEIPDGVTNISASAFSNCGKLSHLVIPKSVVHVGQGAFAGCSGLGSGVVIVDGCVLTVNGTCPQALALPDDVRLIAGGAFANICELMTVTVPDGVDNIGENAFGESGCVVKFAGRPPTSLSAQAFANIPFAIYSSEYADAWTSVLVGDKWRYDAEGNELTVRAPYADGEYTESYGPCTYTFRIVGGEVEIRSVDGDCADCVVPSELGGRKVTRIGDDAYGYKCMLSLTIPEGVTHIGENAFRGCGSMMDISIPASVKSIGYCAFSDCGGLGDGVVIADDCVLAVNGACPENVVLPEGTRLIAGGVFENRGELLSIKIPQSVTGIGAFAFRWTGLPYDMRGMTIADGCLLTIAEGWCPSKVDLSEGVRLVADGAFASCSMLTEVVLPEDTTCLGDHLFESCGELVSVTIPEGVTSVGRWAFSGCGNLALVTVPANVSEIGDWAFSGCGCVLKFCGEPPVRVGEGAFDSAPFGLNVQEQSDAWGEILSDGWWYYDMIGNCIEMRSPYPDGEYTDYMGPYECSFRIRGGEAEITGGSGVIPAELGGRTVTRIGADAFVGSGVCSVAIPGTVKSIGARAYQSCTSLSSVSIAEGVEEIGDGAFSGSAISSVTVPGTVQSISTDTFRSCENLCHVSIGEGVKSIGESAFCECRSLMQIVIPSTVTNIAEGAFAYCDSLSDIQLSEDNECYCLKDGVLYDKSCGTLLFCSRTNRYVTVEPSVTNISAFAFAGCCRIEQIFLPTNVTSIGAHAFESCNCALAFMGPPPAFVGENAFNCIGNGYAIYSEEYVREWIDAIELSGGNWWYEDDFNQSEDGEYYGYSQKMKGSWMYDGFGNSLEIRPPFFEESNFNEALGESGYDFEISYDASLGEHVATITWASIPSGDLVIPSKLGGCPVVAIADGVFSGNYEISSVAIPDGVRTIGNDVFFDCPHMTSIVAPASLKRVGYRAFELCYMLKQITFPTDCIVGTYDENSGEEGTATFSVALAFPETYRWITSFTIPEGTKSIAGVVQLCCGLTSIYAKGAFEGCMSLQKVIIPASVEAIGYRAFANCTALAAINLPDGLSSIGGYAFTGCTTLTFIKIPDSVSEIADGAFSGCCALESVRLPAGLEAIGDYLFADCENLSSIDIPAAVKVIGGYSFSGCFGLVQLAIPDGLEEIREYAFEDCTGLTKIAIPASVLSIANTAFAGCTGIRDVIVPTDCLICRDECDFDDDEEPFLGFSLAALLPDSFISVTNAVVAEGCLYVAADSFANCRALTSVTVASSVTSVDDGAFNHCGKLATVSFLGDAPDVGEGAFYGTPRRMAFKVADGTVGWNGGVDGELPTTWQGRTVVCSGSNSGGGSSQGEGNIGGDVPTGTASVSCVIVSNVVVHYVMNSIMSDMVAPVTLDTGIVNVMSEIKGGNVAIPESWVTNYAGFVEMYGSDFAAALTKPTGKRDAAGNAMLVWQDFVAGTDPTDENDVFTASITTDADGNVIVSYTPELSESEKAKRTYRTFGKVKLSDLEWAEVPTGHEADYNFFKVTVEMK